MRPEIVLLIYLAIPIFFLIRIWRDRSESFWKWIFEVVVFGLGICTIYAIGAWSMTSSYFVRYILLFAFLAVTVKSFRNVNRSYKFGEFGVRKSFPYVVNLVVAGFFFWQIFFIVNGSFCPEKAINLEFPLKGGEFCVVHGGSNLILNHHFPVSAQQYALDILQLNHLGSRINRFNPEMARDYNIFGAIVYSPCDGTVLDVTDQYSDLVPSVMDQEHPAGNYIAIGKSRSDAVIVLAHLMKDSLLVKKGDMISSGQPLAKVGNTGNTSEPHLHIHAVLNNTGDFLFKGKGIPMKFNDKFLVRNDRVFSPEKIFANHEGLEHSFP